MDLLEYHDAAIFGRIWIKRVGGPCDDRAVYTYSVQTVCEDFQNLLEANGDTGIVIADSRSPTPNAAVAHSIFTQKFKTDGDRYPRILEMPTFGHSQNHAGLQVADLLCSAMLFPMATRRYCLGHVQNVHVDPAFGVLASRYGSRLQAMQHRYRTTKTSPRVDSRFPTQSGISTAECFSARPSASGKAELEPFPSAPERPCERSPTASRGIASRLSPSRRSDRPCAR
jgi:hypothetical protein